MANQADEFLVKAQQAKQEALDILAKGDISAEDLGKVEALTAEAASYGEKAMKLKKLQDTLNSMPDEDHPSFKGTVTPQQKQPTQDFLTSEEKYIRGFGSFLQKVRTASRGADVPGLTYFTTEVSGMDESKGLSGSSGTTGGFLIPTEFRPNLMNYVLDHSIVRKRAMVIPMASRQLEVPALKQDATTAGVPHWFGGMVAFWEGEANQIQETSPQFRNVVLTAYELTAVTHASNNLLADSAISLSSLLTGPQGFPGVIAWMEDYAFFNGSGAGQPRGVLNAGATISVSRTTSSTIKYDDLANIMQKAVPSNNLVWVASISAKSTLMLMNGPSGNPAYLWGSATNGMPETLLGYPIIFSEKVPMLGSKGDIGLYDFSHYYVGDRQATTIESSTEAKWLYNQTSWKVVHRVDGSPWLNSFFTLADGTTTVSPFVVLAA